MQILAFDFGTQYIGVAVEGPFKPEIGSRSIRPTMSLEAMRKEFEDSLPDEF